jgi:P-type conjugative transfer protein TrbJ
MSTRDRWVTQKWGRVLAGAAMVVSAALPAQAHAQFGIGGIVFDPRSLAQSVLIYKRAYDQLTAARQQLQEQVTALAKLRNPNWRTISTLMSQADAYLRQQNTLGYGLPSLDAMFQRTFPGAQVVPNYETVQETQALRTLATLRGVLNATGRTAQDFPTGVTRLTAMKAQLAQVQGHEAALELGNTVGVYTAEGVTLLQQQIAAQTNAQAVYFAHEINGQVQAEANSRALLTWLATPPPTSAQTFRPGMP